MLDAPTSAMDFSTVVLCERIVLQDMHLTPAPTPSASAASTWSHHESKGPR